MAQTDGFSARTFTEDGTTVVALAGEVDLATAPVLDAALTDAVDAAPSTLVIDLADLDFMDSTAAGVMVRAGNRLVESGGMIAVRRPRPHIRRAIDIMGLNLVFGLED
ncbi:MAG TPA: STAS domain-containing protein [Acidimicrobiales bacterium]|nr:STAS domain-containing protein [Acidimicrobiales bacterium]